MKKHLHFYMVVILCVSFVCCIEKKRNHRIKNSISQKASELPDGFTPIKEVDTVFTPNAPYRISRKIRRLRDGHLLITALSDVMHYDGKSLSKISKPEGLESFDALEDSKGNIWIASTHYGVFRYDGNFNLNYSY
ncbi:hypothetical protein AAG747_03865 [Rapidithrix thailandica]|uniref:Uncharacterized protein n=1 Tax=Rapidithrix thailandica TaxID=413964 RepID=A0AAW9S046_9BACT